MYIFADIYYNNEMEGKTHLFFLILSGLLIKLVLRKSIFQEVSLLTEKHLAVFRYADLQTRYDRQYKE